MSAQRPRVVLVDDHAMFRAGVRSELGERVEVVGEAATPAEAVAVIARTAPDVVLLDVHLPDGGGRAVLEQVLPDAAATAGAPSAGEPRFLALSVSDAPEDVIAVIRAGARGYVTKTIGADELADAVVRVAEGDVVFSPRLAGFVLDAFRAAAPGPDSGPDGPDGGPDAGSAGGTPGTPLAGDRELDTLTPREREVLRLLARGWTYREIGAQLFISVKTVETHASNVLRKLQLSSRHQLTRWAAERRID